MMARIESKERGRQTDRKMLASLQKFDFSWPLTERKEL
jgi:hypothetical protein